MRKQSIHARTHSWWPPQALGPAATPRGVDPWLKRQAARARDRVDAAVGESCSHGVLGGRPRRARFGPRPVPRAPASEGSPIVGKDQGVESRVPDRDRRRGGWLAATFSVVALAPSSFGAAAFAVPHAGAWSGALEVPGSLNTGVTSLGDPVFPGVNAISCPSADTCSAGGAYTDHLGNGQAFVVNEVSGTWQRAEEVPGSALLNVGGRAEVNTISCVSAGYCSAGGDYTGRGNRLETLVVKEVAGRWQPAIEVPESGVLNGSGDASVVSMSCRTQGNCSAGGYYAIRGEFQAFVVDEISGAWQRAEEVPGTGVLNVGGNAKVRSVSCASAGDCSAGGYYATGKSKFGAFVANEVNGTWERAEEVPNTARLDTGHLAGLDALSCNAVGACNAVGDYLMFQKSRTFDQPFVVSEQQGVWGKAVSLPLPPGLIAAGQVDPTALSCATTGNCTLGGSYWNRSGHWLVWTASDVAGTWHGAREIPGTAALNAGDNAQVNSVSCGLAEYCAVGGYVTTARKALQAFVVLETGGVWHGAQILPNSERLNTGNSAEVNAVSCTVSGFCGVGGDYTARGGSQQLLVANFQP